MQFWHVDIAGERDHMTDFLGTPNLRLERDGPVAWCTIDRPVARNAMTPAMYFGLRRAVRLVNTDPVLAALIITGNGDVFCPGGELGGRQDEGEESIEAVRDDFTPFAAIRESEAPVVVAINGICQGGGLLFAMMADIAVVSERAQFRVPELLRGLPDPFYGAYLPAYIGMARAKELYLTARPFGATEAQAMGLVARVVKHDQLRVAALQAVEELLQTAPGARVMAKRMLYELCPTPDTTTLRYARDHSPELREGFDAFIEKRAPNWVPESMSNQGRL